MYLPDFNHLENGQVSSGWLRVSHRELDTERSTPYQPVLKHKRLMKLNKGEIVPVEVEILPASIFLSSGESLVLVIKAARSLSKISQQVQLQEAMGIRKL